MHSVPIRPARAASANHDGRKLVVVAPPVRRYLSWYHPGCMEADLEAKPRILLTNDDGIRSPGLWAAAEALARIGEVTIAAPRLQWSGAGRSMPSTSEGRIHEEDTLVNGRRWKTYAIDGTPAQSVQFALLELMPQLPDLVVSGINYGENVGSGVTISGTVGAALEAASFGAPGLAISLETDMQYHLSHSDEVQFATAAHFTEYFTRLMLKFEPLPDVDVLKVEVPSDATPETEWVITRLSRTRYYLPQKPNRVQLRDKATLAYKQVLERELLEVDSDVHVLLVDRKVSVTPLSLDLTSRVDLRELGGLLHKNGREKGG